MKFMTVLMEHGAEVDHQDNDGITALHWSCASGHLDAVKLLLRYKAFPNFKESNADRYIIVTGQQENIVGEGGRLGVH